MARLIAWQTGDMGFRDTLSIRGLSTDCVVGVYPHERGTPQPLGIDVDLIVDTEPAATSERLSHSLDYDSIAQQIVFLLQSCRFRLLETAAHALAMYLLSPPGRGERRARADALRLVLVKPQALSGRAEASLSIEREAAWCRVKRETAPFGSVHVIHEARDAGIYRLDVAPGRQVPLSIRPDAMASALPLSEGLHFDDVPLHRGAVRRSGVPKEHVLSNPSKRHVTVLVVHCPEPAVWAWRAAG